MNGPIKILVIDNFDSFTFNLVHLIESLDYSYEVHRNDVLSTLTPDEYSHLLIGPGPGLPKTSGSLMAFLNSWPKNKPVLGVCLGMQALLDMEGAEIKNLETVFHGACDKVSILKSSRWFINVNENFNAGRYHSWGYFREDIPPNYSVVAMDDSDIVMAVEHKSQPWFGVQYHPESIMTEFSDVFLRNFVTIEKTKNPLPVSDL